MMADVDVIRQTFEDMIEHIRREGASDPAHTTDTKAADMGLDASLDRMAPASSEEPQIEDLPGHVCLPSTRDRKSNRPTPRSPTLPGCSSLVFLPNDGDVVGQSPGLRRDVLASIGMRETRAWIPVEPSNNSRRCAEKRRRYAEQDVRQLNLLVPESARETLKQIGNQVREGEVLSTVLLRQVSEGLPVQARGPFLSLAAKLLNHIGWDQAVAEVAEAFRQDNAAPPLVGVT